MQLFLVKGYLDVAATSLSDAMALIAALANPSTPANAATIANVTSKLETLVQSDSGEPITVSSIDAASGTISSWVTDASTTVSLGLGDLSAGGTSTFAQILALSISGNTRTGTLALNTLQLTENIRVGLSPWGGRTLRPYTLQIRRADASGSETMALLSILVSPGVLSTTPVDMPVASYLTAAEIAAIYLAQTTARLAYVQNRSLTGIASGAADATKLCGIATASMLSAGTKILASFAGGIQVLFELEATTASSAGFLFAPFDYNGVTNAVKWRVLAAYRYGQPMIYNNGLALWHYTVAVGTAGAVTVTCDQTGTALPA